MEKDPVDRLLRAAHTGMDPGVTTPDCLDAEALAAWMADRLGTPQRARAEAHVAGCARCQSMLAVMARAEEATGRAAAAPPRSRFWRILPWAAPLTAAATAAALWLAVRPDLVQPVRIDEAPSAVAQRKTAADPPPPSEPSASRELADAPVTSEKKMEGAGRRAQPPAEPSKDETQPARTEAGTPGGAQGELRDRANTLADLAAKPRAEGQAASALPGTRATPAAPPPPAAPVQTRAPAAQAEAETIPPRAGFARDALKEQGQVAPPVVIASPDRKALWRIESGTTILHSADGGATWTGQSAGTGAVLTAGTAPSATVCWIVGRGGTVLLTTDSRTWRRVTFPEPADLIAVRATSADEAAITTSDGRSFSTRDGGKTWEARGP